MPTAEPLERETEAPTERAVPAFGESRAPRPPRIAVLLHEGDLGFSSGTYLLRLMLEQWRARGLVVEVIWGTSHLVTADVIIPHLDLTITPHAYRCFLDRYPIVVNRRVVDVSKSRTSSHIVGREEPYAGPVIVKTDRNYGGLPERRLATMAQPTVWRVGRGLAARLRRKRTGLAPWKSVEYMDPRDYRVFPSLSNVPPEVFDNEHLVVEKFLPETADGNYCVRYCYFFGNKSVNLLLRSKEKVIKGANASRCEVTAASPEIDAIRRRMGFDYGKFDYVVREGRAVLFDLNRTPSYSTLEINRLAPEVAAHLADGIWSVLRQK